MFATKTRFNPPLNLAFRLFLNFRTVPRLQKIARGYGGIFFCQKRRFFSPFKSWVLKFITTFYHLKSGFFIFWNLQGSPNLQTKTRHQFGVYFLSSKNNFFPPERQNSLRRFPTLNLKDRLQHPCNVHKKKKASFVD